MCSVQCSLHLEHGPANVSEEMPEQFFVWETENFSLEFENLMENFKDGMIISQTTFVGWKIQVEGIKIPNKGTKKWRHEGVDERFRGQIYAY